MTRPLICLLAAVVLSVSAHADEPGLRFDSHRHMRVDEVRQGMRGYGLSVFKGRAIERFDVEVLSILKHFNPKFDVILVRCSGQNLEHTGSIAGMSGSPIYLKDDAGRFRMVGAFAYGWPLMKDPVGGVQPIEYMLDIHDHAPATRPATGAASASEIAPRQWLASDSLPLPGAKSLPPNYPFAGINVARVNPRLAVDDPNTTKLRPLATPLMTTGLPTRALEQFEPVFRAHGLVPLQAGGLAGKAATTQAAPALEPGSVLAVPLITGDVEMAAIGTTTEVQGPYVVGFGHPFNNEGRIALPVGSGEINAVIANLMTSFKLGALSATTGTLYADSSVGVAGRIGKVPPMVPIRVSVREDGGVAREYSFQGASHRRFTPLLSAAALMAAITGLHDLPEFHTVEYDVNIEFTNGQKVRVNNSDVNVNAASLFFQIGSPMLAAADNPFDDVFVKSLTADVHIIPEVHAATILWANAPRLKYRPGETVKAYVSYRPFRGAESILPLEFDLPHDLPDGTYQFTISGWEQYLADEQASKPFRFSAENLDELFAVLRELTGVRHDGVYMRLVKQADGVAIGRTAMPNLPSSRREVIVGAGRSNTTAYISSTTKSVASKFVMDGAAQLELTVERKDKVESPAGKAPRHESAPPRPDEPRPAPRPRTEPPGASENAPE